ncbi:MAG: HAMP domain-containing histidine kinase [Candidatus Eremiobacteraeota bacterium]|nr:HAMP domain-containing histidine kinase [Candidatus Eremiobacteraeota bacterium]
MRQSLASRLAALFALMLGITVVLVIVASSIALVFQLSSFTSDIMIAKREDARILAAQYKMEGVPFEHAAQHIVDDLSGIGLRVAVYDTKGQFLAGDPDLHPRLLDRVVKGQVKLPAPPAKGFGDILEPFSIRTGPPPQRTPDERSILRPTPQPELNLSPPVVPVTIHPEPFALTAVDGGYVAFQRTPWLLWTNLVPYWRVVITIAILAVLISWFLGRLFSRQALAPLKEVTQSLQALAGGDYTQRRFLALTGDEVAALTQAYNQAVAGVAGAMDERKRIEDRMRQFVADAGHELRTPLTVIAGYIDVLRRGAIEEPKVARQILGTMALEKEHMRGLIDRLMRLARLDSETPATVEPIAVDELLKTQVETARRMDDTRQIDYHVDGATEVMADKTELGEALWNLVENALKYAPGAPIHLRAARNNGHTVLSVSDEGPGMSEMEKAHAFERFFRGDSRGEISGTGLGLAIAKRAVERSGGSISIDSSPGRGTTVSIAL